MHNSDESLFHSKEVGSYPTATDPEVQEACVLPTGKEVLYRLKDQNQENKQILDMDPNGKFTHSRHSKLHVITDEALCHLSFYCHIKGLPYCHPLERLAAGIYLFIYIGK